jgi:hypothetical protein
MNNVFAFVFKKKHTGCWVPRVKNNSLYDTHYRGQDSDWLRAGRSGYRISLGARLPAPFQTGLRAHPASYTMGTETFPG